MWNYIPAFEEWVIRTKAQRIEDICWFLTDPIEFDNLINAYWDDYMNTVEGVRDFLSLCATERVIMEEWRGEDSHVHSI